MLGLRRVLSEQNDARCAEEMQEARQQVERLRRREGTTASTSGVAEMEVDTAEEQDENIPAYFPKELAVAGVTPLVYDFSRRLFDLPTTIHFDLISSRELEEPRQLKTYEEVQHLVSLCLSGYQTPSVRDEEDNSGIQADTLDKKKLFFESGKQCLILTLIFANFREYLISRVFM